MSDILNHIILILLHIIMLAGSIVAFVFLIRTGRGIERRGIKKQIFRAAILEIILLWYAASFIYLTVFTPYYIFLWNKVPILPAEIIQTVYCAMLLCVLPVYIIVLVVLCVGRKWKSN